MHDRREGEGCNNFSPTGSSERASCPTGKFTPPENCRRTENVRHRVRNSPTSKRKQSVASTYISTTYRRLWAAIERGSPTRARKWVTKPSTRVRKFHWGWVCASSRRRCNPLALLMGSRGRSISGRVNIDLPPAGVPYYPCVCVFLQL